MWWTRHRSRKIAAVENFITQGRALVVVRTRLPPFRCFKKKASAAGIPDFTSRTIRHEAGLAGLQVWIGFVRRMASVRMKITSNELGDDEGNWGKAGIGQTQGFLKAQESWQRYRKALVRLVPKVPAARICPPPK